MFIGRKSELNYLEKKYFSNQAEMIVLYGRRRIGKTELVKQFIQDKEYIFYAASEVDDYEQRKRFAGAIENKLKLDYLKVDFDSWDTLFRSLAKVPYDKKLIVAIDEFPYMVNGNKAIPSILQNLWDHELKNQNIFIILTGSSVGIMLDNVLGAKNPLYGRVTGSYKLGELPIEDIKQFFPDYSITELIEVYSILGGVPHYLLTFDNKKNIEDNIKEKILAKGTFLYDEVQMLMRQELREPSIYFTLLEAIAMGNTKLNRIYQITQIEKTKIATYLKKLIYLDIVEREYPATEKIKRRVNVQSGLYKIKNNFFRFYFKYLFPNTSLLELHATEQVYQKMIAQDINIHVSQIFEGVCRNHIMKLNIHTQLPIFVIHLGRWWYKQEEIDIVAFDSEKKYIFGECKWRNEPMGIRTLSQLQSKIEKNFGDIISEKIFLFSKSGYTDELLQYALKNKLVQLIDLKDIV